MDPQIPLVRSLDEMASSSAKEELLDPLRFFEEGISLLEYGIEKEDEKALLLASKKFKLAYSQTPKLFELWISWGHALYELGLLTEEHHYFVEAKEKYQKAIAFSQNQERDLLSDLFWNYGMVWSRLAAHSGEALDLHLALDAFQRAHSFQKELPAAFWHDYGNACLELGSQINDIRLHVKAITCFKRALFLHENASFEGWSDMAHAMQLLYERTHDEDHFTQASDAFAAAAELGPKESDLWVEWAELLCSSGRYNQDEKRLRAAIEKCHHVHTYNPDHLIARAIGAQALASVGELTDNLELLFEALDKIAEISELDADNPDILFAHGICLFSCGNYFEDLDYYYQAIEKFQAGLSINRACERLWHALAVVYATLGEIGEDPEAFALAVRFFNKALDLHPFSSPVIFDYALTLARFGESTHNQERLEEAVVQFQRALAMQKNAIYLHPEWLFHYACTLDSLGDYHAEESYYQRSLEIFSHVLMCDPNFPTIHHKIGLAHTHLGDLSGHIDQFYRAAHHCRLAMKNDEDNDAILLDWGITLLYIATHSADAGEVDLSYREAENKMTEAAKLGNTEAYYQLSCLYSLLRQPEKALFFMEKAEAHNALPSIDDIMDDEWLENLRITGEFQLFLTQLEKKKSLRE